MILLKFLSADINMNSDRSYEENKNSMSKILGKQDQHGVSDNQESIFIFNNKIKDGDFKLVLKGSALSQSEINKLLSPNLEVDLHCAENASIIYRNYMLAICLIGFFGPLIIIIFCYARILGIMYSSEKKMRKGSERKPL